MNDVPRGLRLTARRYLIALGVVGAAMALAFFCLGQPMTGIDDANIFMVYARHVAAGAGAVYQLGGERVEGFTSLLWMLLMSVVYWLRLPPEPTFLLLCLLLTAGTLTLWWEFLAARLPSPTVALVASTIWMGTSAPFIIWMTLAMMDVTLWTFLLSAGVTAALRPARGRWLLLVLLLLPLTRPEGVVWGIALSLVAALRRRTIGRMAEARRLLLAGVGTTLGSAALLLVARLAYFGHPFPNTYYAKVSPSLSYNLIEGLAYLLTFLWVHPLVTALLLLLPPVAWLRWRYRQPWPRADRFCFGALFGLIALGLLLPVVTGGDHFEGHRFYQPLWPLLPILLFLLPGHRRLSPRVAGAALVLWAALCLAPLAGRLAMKQPPPLREEFAIAEGGREIGAALSQWLDGEAPLLGVAAAGGIAHGYEGPVFDLLGLNSVAMAHAPGDRAGFKNHAAFSEALFYQQPPPLLLPRFAQRDARFTPFLDATDGSELVNRTLKGLLAAPRFQALYAHVQVRTPDARLLLYVRRDVLPTLQAAHPDEVTVLEHPPFRPAPAP